MATTTIVCSDTLVAERAHELNELTKLGPANEIVDTVELISFIKALDNQLLTENRPAFTRKQPIQIPKAPAINALQDLECAAEGALSDEVAKESVLGGKYVQVDELPKPTPDARKIVTPIPDELESSPVSDAVSDTSFTPPKHLGRFVRLDKDGRPHVLPPPGFKPFAPERVDERSGHKSAQLGFPEFKVKPVEPFFQRKYDYRKAGVEKGGISLAREREWWPHKVRRSVPDEPVTPIKNCEPKDKEAAFWTRLFEIEEDYVYNGRWPTSTF
ncbi:hypothetical protein GGS21DRAFT_547037 [Xylaria nigripes]|nr:hypothetical protein GGS21DRAFT_547037 [Xylaria nigripes]